MKTLWFLALNFWLGSVSTFAQTPQDFQVIRENLIQQILQSPARVQDVADWKSKLNADGSFSDVDYLNTQGSTWAPTSSLARSLAFIKAIQTPGTAFYQDQTTEAAALRSIQFIARGSWWNFNWWTREIALPLTTYKILLLFDSKLDEASRTYLQNATLEGHLLTHPSGWPAEGQNLIWYSETTLALGSLFKRADWIDSTLQALSKGLSVGQFQGIQEDHSFYQHDKLFYSGGYGLNFSNDVARFFEILNGSSFQFSHDQYSLLSQYILDGQLYLVHGKTLDVSSMGRYYPRENGASPALLKNTCARMAKITGARSREFQACALTLQDSSHNGREGTASFWKADFFTHNQSGYGISVRLNSNRTMNADSSPLGEGLKSEFLADGLTYIYRDGSEYWNIYPILDYLHLPGTTENTGANYPTVLDSNYTPHFGTQSFVGSLAQEDSGITTFDFLRNTLSAKKSNFFFKGGMIALGASVHCSDCESVQTTLNQEWSTTDLQYALTPESFSTLANGSQRVTNPLWAWANEVGYLFLSPETVHLKNEKQTGSWQSIATLLSPAPVIGKVMSLSIDHGSHPENTSYAYAVLPGKTVDELAEFAQKPDFKILQNNEKLQAIAFEDGLLEAVFFQAGQLASAEFSIEVDQAVLLALKSTSSGYLVSVADPTQKLTQVTVRLKSKKGDLRFTLALPQGGFAGQTLQKAIPAI